MLASVELLQTRPSCDNCVAWSADGEIAVAAYDHILLLVPLRQPGDKTWEVLRICVNEFSETEWPSCPPQAFSRLSLGEEQSNSHVIALSWSAPGLALHQRCTLAVLTANHLLSLWSCDGDPLIKSCWKRVLVINQTPTIGRLTSFAWSPNEPVLAVCDDQCRLSILGIQSPSDVQQWRFHQRFSQTIPRPAHAMPPSLFRMHMDRTAVLLLLACDRLPSGDLQLRLICADKQILVNTASQSVSEPSTMPAVLANPQNDWKEEIHKLQQSVGQSTRRDASLIDVRQRGSARLGGYECTTLYAQVSDEITFKSRSEETTVLVFRQYAPDNLPWRAHNEHKNEQCYSDILGTIRQYMASHALTMADAKIAFNSVLSMSLEENAGFTILSLEILQELAKLAACTLPPEQELIQTSKGDSKKRSEMLNCWLQEPETPAFLLDPCPVPGCRSIIGFEPRGRAVCLARHAFGQRCSITSLPVLRTGISKYCSGCGRAALNAQILQAAQARVGNNGRPDGLAMHLLDAFSTCPFCRAKYYLLA